MNHESSMIQRIEALPEARKNTILTAIWLKTLTGTCGAVYTTDIETLVKASEQVETEGANGYVAFTDIGFRTASPSLEDFYEQEQRDDEADNTPKSDRDTVLVDGIGTMLRIQAASCACERRSDHNLTLAYQNAAYGPAYKEAK